MKAMAAVNVAIAAQQAAGAVTDLMSGGMGGIKVSANLSHNQSKNHFEESGRNVVGSLVAAGGNVDIQATGAGADSTLMVSGSRIDAGENVHLKADGAVTLKAGENTAHQKSKDSSAGASIGIGFAVGGAQNGFTIDLSASASRGKSDGDDQAWKNTHINAGGTFNIESGGDTTLSGAVVNAKQIVGDIKGNLKIESLQDSSTYHSSFESAGVAVSLCIPPICAGVSTVGGNFSQTKIDSNFLAVTEQSGLRAGDGGYQIRVGGDTHLIGGVIASSDKAIAEGKNRFEHGGSVKLEDIHNRVEFSGDAIAVAATVGTQVGDQSNTSDLGHEVAAWNERNGGKPSSSSGNGDSQPSATFGSGADAGLQLSVTSSGIGVSTSADTAGIIAPIFNAADVRRELGAQTRITQTFSQLAPKAVADLAKSRMQPMLDAETYDALQRQQADGRPLTPQQEQTLREVQSRGMTADRAHDMLNDAQAREEAERWSEGGIYRVALHTAVGALGGGVDGALGAGTVAAAAPLLENIQQRVNASLVEAGLSAHSARLASQGLAQLTAAGLGAVAGNTQGAGYGLAVDTNNRQLHPRQVAAVKQKAKALAGRDGKTAAQWETELTQQLLRQNDSSYSTYTENATARNILAELQETTGVSMSAEGSSEYTNHALNAQYLYQNVDSYLRVPAPPGRVNPSIDNLSRAFMDATSSFVYFGALTREQQGIFFLQLNAYADALQRIAGTPAAVQQDPNDATPRSNAVQRAVVDAAARRAGDFMRELGTASERLRSSADARMGMDVTQAMIGAAVASGAARARLAEKSPAEVSPSSSVSNGPVAMRGGRSVGKADAEVEFVGPQMPDTYVSPEMQEKILWGMRQLRADGTPSNGLIGAHSGEIGNYLPDYAVEVLRNNADGTSSVKLVKQFDDGNVSRIKSSTLFPSTWSEADVLGAIQTVGAPGNAVASRLSDGSTLYQGTVNGVNIEVIKIGGRVTAAYPTGGGFTSLDTFGLTPKPRGKK